VEPLAVGALPAPTAPPPDPAQPAAPDPSSRAQEVPKYLRLVRHDLRARTDQLEGIAALRRRILADRARGERSERITDNTLLRVAIDLLLAHGDDLAGATEDQLRESALRATAPRHHTT
jgi:hypothetical protein